MSETPTQLNLTPGAQRLIEAVRQKRDPATIDDWLLTLMERHGLMAESVSVGINATVMIENLRAKIKQGNLGVPFDSDACVGQALERAKARGKEQASERDLAAVILLAAGYEIKAEAPPETATATVAAASNAPASPTATWQPVAKRPTPTLDRLGLDVTRAAQQGKISPLVGRIEEIRIVIETLCRRTKRNPVLVGPAGVGKTAIVEGLAQRIVEGHVPALLRGTRIVSLQRSALIGGAQSSADLAGRLQSILKEAAQDGIILFIDELHSFMEFADDLKPALARGDIACIGATTDDEYRQFIEQDRALERRFQPLRIQALNAEQTLVVLESLRGTVAKARGVDVSQDVLEHLVTLAARYLRNRQFPDKAVDLFEQCVAYALSEGKTIVDRADADFVVQRLIGMPLSTEDRVETLHALITDRGLLSEAEATALCARLSVTLGGFDLHPERPNAAVLLMGSAARNAEQLAQATANTLYGGEDRVVVFDVGPLTQEHQISILLGSPPGYVGYNQRLPLHQITQTPWCVFVCQNVDQCHPSIRAILAQGLATGQITDAGGRRTYLSDTVVILTVAAEVAQHRVMGFRHAPESQEAISAEATLHEEVRQVAAKLASPELVDECDLVCSAQVGTSLSSAGEGLLTGLRERYLREKLHLNWEPSVIAWLKSQESHCHSTRDWERLIDERLTPLLAPYCTGHSTGPVDLTITADEGALLVTPQPKTAVS